MSSRLFPSDHNPRCVLRTLVAIPIYNESRHVQSVLNRVRREAVDVLVVDDGSTDQTPELLGQERGIALIRHMQNRGYGRSISDSFAFALAEGYDIVITMDCDDQHEPSAIPEFVREMERTGADIVSGSRYLSERPGDPAPVDRRLINLKMTAEINCRLASLMGTRLSDAFCGFKAHRVDSLRELNLTETGYAFPMQFWVQAAAARLQVREMPVARIYQDLSRTFGGVLDDPEHRLRHYQSVLRQELRRQRSRLPADALSGIEPDSQRCGCGPACP